MIYDGAGNSVALELAMRDASIEAFKHPAEILEPEEEDVSSRVKQVAEVLTPVLLFLSRGRLTGTLDARAWVILYEVSPERLNGETIAAFAERRGMSTTRVHELITQFRGLVPLYRSSRRRSDLHVQHMREAHLALMAPCAGAADAKDNADAKPPRSEAGTLDEESSRGTPQGF